MMELLNAKAFKAISAQRTYMNCALNSSNVQNVLISID